VIQFLFNRRVVNYSAFIPWLFVGLVLTGCQTPIGVSRVDPLTVHHQLTQNVLSANLPSIFTENVLHQYDLTEKFAREPEAALAELHRILLEHTVRSEEAFALSELSFLHAEQKNTREYFLASALYAFLFLFPDDPDQIPNPFDPRLRIASDLYNRGLTSGFASDDGSHVLLQSHVYDLPFGQLDVSVAEESLRWGDRQLVSFIPVAELEVHGLRNRYRNPGIGAPLAADQLATEPGKGLAVANMKVPVTAVLLVEGLFQQLATGQMKASLEVYVAYDKEVIKINGQTVPLEVETTSALAASLSESPVWERELKGFFLGDLATRRPTQLGGLEPYRPGRVPVVFVHGTASSAGRWAEMVNDLMNDPCIRGRFQFWFFTYDTGNPILYSAMLLRETLDKVVSELDPQQKDSTLRNMIVIGHSQGGLLTKLIAVDPQSKAWDVFSDEPLEAMDVSEKTRDLFQRAFFFKPLPYVTRVVFISTPHRGSYVAGSWISHQLTRFIKLPGHLVAGLSDVMTQNQDKLTLKFQSGRFSSVDAMTPGSPLVSVLAPLPISSNVAAHSIIAVKGDGPKEDGEDGVVAYSSAHLEDVDSELVVRSGHSSQGNPHTIEEVLRILLLHVGQKC
jgi:triacylglycerol esterase/lipase EstA (alpha/beta hydrolase family)